MRFIACLLLLIGSAAAQTGTAPAPASPEQANSQHARSLLEKALKALGGQAYLSVVDMNQEGRSYGFYHGQAKGVGTRFWRFWKWPDKERIELTKERDIIYIHNGDKGYEITFRGTRPEAARDLEEFLHRRQYSLDQVFRVWLTQPGVQFFYDRVAVAENKPAEQVTIMTPGGLAQTIFLDRNNSLPIAKSFTFRDPETRERTEELESYDNYHLVQGVNTPLTITRKQNGEMFGQRFITSTIYNSGLADSLFSATPTYDPEAKKP
jgi:hypothetical protein